AHLGARYAPRARAEGIAGTHAAAQRQVFEGFRGEIMTGKNRPFVIALEEHYWDAEVSKTFDAGEARSAELRKRLEDTSALRIQEMDEAGIDVQVLSHAAPSTQRLDGATAVPLARRANDRLSETVRAHPDRFAAFAALPTADPKAAADELERTVDKLGFKGAMVHGPTNGVFFD